MQPSAVVRFAQRFGFAGFSAMQAVFRDDYAEQASPLLTYQQRIRTLIASKRRVLTGGAVAREFIAGSMSGLEELSRDLDDSELEAAVGLLEKAENIYVVGVRRSYAVAAYIVYALSHTDKRVHLISGDWRHVPRADALGAPQRRRDGDQLHAVRRGDARLRAARASAAQREDAS